MLSSYRRLLGSSANFAVVDPQLMTYIPLTHLLTAVALATVLTALYLAVRRWRRRLVRQRQWLRARSAESEAPRLLEKLGYGVLGAQVEGSYSLVVDGQPIEVSLRVDYIVGRGGRRFVAEVKSGRLAPRLDTAATRRQLLEYLITFQVNGVLLVDGEARSVHQVEFPIIPHSESGSWFDKSTLWVAGALLVGIILWMLRSA